MSIKWPIVKHKRKITVCSASQDFINLNPNAKDHISTWLKNHPRTCAHKWCAFEPLAFAAIPLPFLHATYFVLFHLACSTTQKKWQITNIIFCLLCIEKKTTNTRLLDLQLKLQLVSHQRMGYTGIIIDRKQIKVVERGVGEVAAEPSQHIHRSPSDRIVGQ